jgi:choline-phosphate cytidylyltransferase
MTRVITYGTFDLFHEGHYRLLKRAKELGDYLIVGVTTEKYDMERGKLNVVDSLMTRIENVKKSEFADEVIIEEAVGQKISDVQKYHIDIFAIGSDWMGAFDYISDYCKVIYLERTKNISSTMLREQNRLIQKVGIIGTGRIANRFVPESKQVSGIDVQWVYNPNRDSAERFAKVWEINFSDDLELFLQEIDSVYVASPHQTHYNYVKVALEHGKHVLCEKPMVLKKYQSEELFDYARQKNLVLFEGIKTAYCPGFEKLLGIACSGIIGNIHYIDACFTKLEDKNKRELTDTVYGGSLTELGSYCLLPIIKLFGNKYEDVRFEVIHDSNGLDIFTKVSFHYPKGIATATCGLGVKSEGRLLIAGTKGYIVASAPWWKTTYFEVHYENASQVDKYSERFFGDGLRYEIRDFLNMINGDDKSVFKLTRSESIAMAEIMEKFLKQERKTGII